jgi:hypothetical protein
VRNRDKVKSSVEGHIDDLGELGIDGFKDHAMDRYLTCLRNNLD